MESVIVICGTNQPLWLQVFKFQSCDPCRKKQVGVDLVDLKRGDKKLSQQQQQKVLILHDIRVTRLGEASGVCFLHTQLETTTSAE